MGRDTLVTGGEERGYSRPQTLAGLPPKAAREVLMRTLTLSFLLSPRLADPQPLCEGLHVPSMFLPLWIHTCLPSPPLLWFTVARLRDLLTFVLFFFNASYHHSTATVSTPGWFGEMTSCPIQTGPQGTSQLPLPVVMALLGMKFPGCWKGHSGGVVGSAP